MEIDYKPHWFDLPDSCGSEEELKERLEYERVQLDMLKLDMANTEVRIALLQDKIDG